MSEDTTPASEDGKFPPWILVIIAFVVILSIVSIILVIACVIHKREKPEIIAAKRASAARRLSPQPIQMQHSKSEKIVKPVIAIQTRPKVEQYVPSSEAVQPPSSSAKRSSLDGDICYGVPKAGAKKGNPFPSA